VRLWTGFSWLKFGP